jgi:hypothetical protein
MSGNKSTAFAIAFIDELFNQTSDIPNITDGDTLYISLHTADPAGGDQTSNEADYDDYARVAMVRGTDWGINDNQAVNAADVEFPQCNASFDPDTQTITHVGIGVESSGAGLLLYSKSLAVPLVVGALVTPKILAEQITITET